MKGSSPRDGRVREWFTQPWQRLALSALRLCLVMLWLLWAMLAWWSAPRPVDADQVRSDIAAGRVSSTVRAELWEDDQRFWGSPPGPRVKPDGLLLVWTTKFGQIRYTAPALAERPADVIGAGGIGGGHGTQTAQLARQLGLAQERAGPATIDHRSLASATRGLAGVLMVLCLAVVFMGPRPQRGTRVFWFWISWIPFGLGVLAWLATETPWSGRAPRGGDVPEPAPRQGGLTGFALLVVGSIALAAVTMGLRALLGTWIVPG